MSDFVYGMLYGMGVTLLIAGSQIVAVVIGQMIINKRRLAENKE